MAGVLGPAGQAVTTRPAAMLGDGDEAGGQDRSVGGQFLEAGVEHTPDQGRVFGDAHDKARQGDAATERWRSG
jgi:hypothetical protein